MVQGGIHQETTCFYVVQGRLHQKTTWFYVVKGGLNQETTCFSVVKGSLNQKTTRFYVVKGGLDRKTRVSTCFQERARLQVWIFAPGFRVFMFLDMELAPRLSLGL